jgi:hypothetical protein
MAFEYSFARVRPSYQRGFSGAVLVSGSVLLPRTGPRLPPRGGWKVAPAGGSEIPLLLPPAFFYLPSHPEDHPRCGFLDL